MKLRLGFQINCLWYHVNPCRGASQGEALLKFYPDLSGLEEPQILMTESPFRSRHFTKLMFQDGHHVIL